MFTLIKNGTVYAPDPMGSQDILIAAGQIIMIKPKINIPKEFFGCEIIDAAECFILPGFIDQHVHIAGAGGEGGPATRTPEIGLTELTSVGITTVIGLLGFDGFTRSMTDLLAKARGLEAEGLTTYIYSGAYQIPTTTLTGSLKSDLVLIDKVIGVGEVAISDHRSTQPTVDMLVKVASEARIGGMIGNKAGIVHVHIGEGKHGLSLIFDAVNNSDIPLTQFVPTHVNRLSGLFDEAVKFAKMGGVIDLTAGFSPQHDSPQSLEISQAIEILIENEIDLTHITVSSDSNGSMPVFDISGKLIRLEKATPKPFWDDICKLTRKEILSLSAAVSLITRNPARLLKLYPRKGTVAVGSDADLVFVNKNTLKIDKVFARGKLMVNKGLPLVKGNFE